MAVTPFLLWAGSVRQAAGRLAHPLTAYSRPADTAIALRPGNADVIAGEPFEIIADLSGIVPLRARLETRESGGSGEWVTRLLSVRRDRVRHRIDAVTRDFQYRLRANDAVTPAYHLTVRPRPMVVSIKHHLTLPSYTRQPERSEAGGDIVAPAGSHVRVDLETSLPLDAAWLDFDSGRAGTRVNSVIDGQRAVAEFEVLTDARYTIRLLDPNQIPNAHPVEYRIVALQDQPPQIRLLQPGNDTELGIKMTVPLVVEAHDDFGLGRMELIYRINDKPDEVIIPVAMDSTSHTVGHHVIRDIVQHHLWDLSRLRLFPGDSATYRLRVYDTNELTGPGIAETPVFSVRFPSLLEIRERAMQSEERGLQQMEAARETGRDLQQRLEKIAREMMRQDQMEWSQQQELEAAISSQHSIGKQLESALKDLSEAVQRMDEGGALQPETLQKLLEVQDLLRSVQTPELKLAMDKLKEALQDLDAGAVEEALEEFRREQEDLQRGLDRTIALLRGLRDQQNLDALVRAIQELADRQQELAELTSEHTAEPHPPDPPSLAQRQEHLKGEAERFAEELQQSARELESESSLRKELEGMGQQFREKRIPPRMGEAARNLQNDRSTRGAQQAQSLAEDLQDLAGKLSAVRQKYVDDQKADVARDLEASLRDLLELSRRQEEMVRRADKLRSGQKREAGDAALEQARIMNGTRRAAERLLDVSQKTFLLSPQAVSSVAEALQKMSAAAKRLQEPGPSRASRDARDAMGSLNVAAMLVSRAQQSLASAASAIGFDEMLARLEEMAGQQQQVNAGTQQQMGQGGEQPGRFGRLSARQQAIQEALRLLREESGASQDRLLGDLGNIASDMEDVARDLKRRRITPKTVERQRQILSRLLDAQRSVRERGFSRQRQARAGVDVAYRGPGSLPADLGEADNPLREKLREALRQGYSSEYQSLIRRYFERLIQDAREESGGSE